MFRNFSFLMIASLGLALPSVACRDVRPATAIAPLSLSLLHSGSFGGFGGESKSPEAVWITDENQWRDLLARTSEVLDASPATGIEELDIDFAGYGVLLIRMGDKPTGGYGLRLSVTAAQITNRTATVPVQWIEPGEGSITTQAITSPYIVVKMAKGPFDSIAIVDQDGAVRLRLSLESLE
jgi:hypothetical protein